jgi:hypothetical protein
MQFLIANVCSESLGLWTLSTEILNNYKAMFQKWDLSINPVILNVIHHCQNPLDFTGNVCCSALYYLTSHMTGDRLSNCTNEIQLLGKLRCR